MTISIFSIFGLEVSSIFIAAILSIIGYAVNDIIIVFDRIRENVKKSKAKKETEKSLVNVANKSLREVFNRSIITMGSTLIPVVSLIILGSHEIITFNIALLVGLMFGTLSTLFVASQLWLEIEKRNIGKEKKKIWYEEDADDEVDEMNIKGINS
jgi:SecD/SecF fusion protein